MSTLRLIILLVGLIFIAVIYFWESIKNKRLQRKQTIRRVTPEYGFSNIRTAQEQDAENDYSDVQSELSQTLTDSNDPVAAKEQERLIVTEKEEKIPEQSQTANVRTGLETRDMFADFVSEPDESSDLSTDVDQDIDKDQIIALHITALPTGAFNGTDIIEAVNDVGLEYGEMNIFHHYGVGDMRGDQPLFSLADMFEPGNFELTKLNQHNTRGLTLFFCLPSRIDGQVTFELMLNTAQRLAQQLGGEIRGAGQELIDDEQITGIRNKINQYTYA